MSATNLQDTADWWKEAVIYQVYPRSFQDSDGDGFGDIRGIISRVDYIASLGVDAVWLNPVYASPDHDNGYDISDYRSISPLAGTMADMELLIRRLHENNIRLIMDMVVNHTSDQHEWFKQACLSRDNRYYKFYHWWPAEKGDPPERRGLFDPAGKGWHYNPPTDSWYLHYFSAEQPDLNWENPIVREQVYHIFRFWLEKGVDGFRMDAVTFISKDANFPPFDPELFAKKYHSDWGHYYADGPTLHAHLREMRAVLDEYGAVSIAEAPGIIAGRALEYVGADRKELHMLCQFEGINIGYIPAAFKKIDAAGFSIKKFKEVYSCWTDIFLHDGWGTLYLGNHDQPRMVSRWGNDSSAFREVSAKLLMMFLMTMRSTPFIYNGDELGMTNIRFKNIGEYADIETRHMYKQIEQKGGDLEAFLRDQQEAARDNSRTPFQWDTGVNAGFSSGKPWISVNENYHTINRADQERDPASILHFTRKTIALRKATPALIFGDYQLLPSPTGIYAFTRTLDGETYIVLLNFTQHLQIWMSPAGSVIGDTVVLNNYEALDIDATGKRIHLLPYQGLVLRSFSLS